MHPKQIGIFTQDASKSAYRRRFQVPLNLSSLEVYVKSKRPSAAGFWLDQMHQAFSRFFVKEQAEAKFVNRRKTVLLLHKGVFDVGLLFFQVVFYYFLAL